jgi:hypothetical protein
MSDLQTRAAELRDQERRTTYASGPILIAPSILVTCADTDPSRW